MRDEERTVFYSPQEDRERSAALIILDTRNKPMVISLQGNMTLGRVSDKSACDICVYSKITGRRHGEFICDGPAGE